MTIFAKFQQSNLKHQRLFVKSGTTGQHMCAVCSSEYVQKGKPRDFFFQPGFTSLILSILGFYA